MERPSSPDVRTFRDLIAWQKGIRLALLVYRLTKRFPDEEKFGMVSQMRRSAVSIPANIAEGYGRGRRAEYVRYLEIGRGSLFEVQTYLELAREMQWVDGEELGTVARLAEEVDRVVSALLRSLKRRRA
jgi:four helix bundle protein